MSAMLSSHTALLVHLAALVQLSGFLMRDQVTLRVLVLTGNALYITYYYVHPATPLWDAMFWSGAMLLANLVMTALILRDRRTHGLSDEALHVYGAFGGMVPGDFRRLMRRARIHRADGPVTLTQLGVRPESLFYVIEGRLTVERRDRRLAFTGSGTFIAEIGFLLGTPATATVTLDRGARYVEWDRKRLSALFERSPVIRHAVERALSRDLATKLAQDTGPASPAPAETPSPAL